MKRILLALGLVAALCSSAAARGTLECDNRGCWNPVTFSPPLGTVNLAQFVQPEPQPGGIGVPAVIAPPAIIDTGSIAGQALTWVITVGGGAIATLLTGLIYKLMQKAGIQITDAARARLQEIILNGLNAGTKVAAAQLAGKGQVVIKQAAVASTVAYVQAHGKETMAQLGLDPTSPEAVEAIKARIETAIADPAVATPPVLDPPAPPSLLGGGAPAQAKA
jgi:hypothetical protein